MTSPEVRLDGSSLLPHESMPLDPSLNPSGDSVGRVGEQQKADWVFRSLPSTRWLWRYLWRWLLVLFFALVMLGGAAIPAMQQRTMHFALSVAGHSWDLIGWEIDALYQKAVAAIQKPADELSETEGVQTVRDYMVRALRIGEIEDILARRASVATQEIYEVSSAELIAELQELRALQNTTHAQVEQVIEGQVGSELAISGFSRGGFRVWPPVSFAFVEPPKKLLVSRRDRIETIYSQMLDADIELAEIIAAEDAIRQEDNSIGYITDIGGLGAFPTMVIDRASLRWILSTVAHEWVHNYLALAPLGWNYFASQELTTMNETVAEIVGNEIGDRTLTRYYPDLVPQPVPQPVSPPVVAENGEEDGGVEAAIEDEVAVIEEPPPFSFFEQMRVTRLEVDRLLAAGDVEGAESYMEARRKEFVDHGYPLRVLNQAYFAFHGSYGSSSPSSTSPIGPMMEELRMLMPDLETFLTVVRDFTSVEQLEQALDEWSVKS